MRFEMAYKMATGPEVLPDQIFAAVGRSPVPCPWDPTWDLCWLWWPSSWSMCYCTSVMDWPQVMIDLGGTSVGMRLLGAVSLVSMTKAGHAACCVVVTFLGDSRRVAASICKHFIFHHFSVCKNHGAFDALRYLAQASLAQFFFCKLGALSRATMSKGYLEETRRMVCFLQKSTGVLLI